MANRTLTRRPCWIRSAPTKKTKSLTALSRFSNHERGNTVLDRNTAIAEANLEVEITDGPLNVWGLLPVNCATAIYLFGQMALITYVPRYPASA